MQPCDCKWTHEGYHPHIGAINAFETHMAAFLYKYQKAEVSSMIEIILFMRCPRVHFRLLHVQKECIAVIANGECLECLR